MTTYLCPNCKSQMFEIVNTSIPPIIFYYCFSCGYKSKSVNEICEVKELPEWLRNELDDIKGEN